MKDLHGKTALITGAASGIGRAIALGLARRGVNLWLLDIDEPQLMQTAGEVREHGVEIVARTADVARPDEIHAVVQSLHDDRVPLDILVNNAGIAFYGPTEQMSGDDWNRVLAVNLLAPLQFTRELLPLLLGRPEAHLLNVCSIAGLVAMPRLAAYHVTKFALVGLSESLRAEFGPRGLGVTAICPGFVRTNLFQTAKTGGGKKMPKLPDWLCTTADHVAERAIRAIYRREGVVIVTPLAHFLWRFKRYAPGLLDWLQQFRRHRRHGPAARPLVPVAAVNGRKKAA